MADKTTCRGPNGCGTQWTALGECHCPKCHLHFSSIKSFDKHLKDRFDKGEFVGVDHMTLDEITNHVTTKERTKETHPTFLIREDENSTIALFDPYRDERLDKMASASTKNAIKTQTKGKAATKSKTTTKATTKAPKPEKRVCAEDKCKKVLQKKPGRGRWPVRCNKHGGTGLV